MHRSNPLPAARLRPPDPASSKAWLDLAHLDRQTDGDRALAVELLALFEAQAAEVLGRIVCGEPAPPLAHRLKGAARAVGAWQVALAADRVEEGSEEAGTLARVVAQTCRVIAQQRTA